MPSTGSGPRRDWTRARRPDERATRSAAIKAAAVSRIVSGRPLGEISLAEIAAEAGLSSPGVYTYFDGRDAILLAVAADEVDAWVTDLLGRLEYCGVGDVDALVDAVDRSLIDRRVLVVLLGSLAGLLEAGTDNDSADRKRQMAARVATLEAAVARLHPQLDAVRTVRLLRALIVGLWSFTSTDPITPSPSELAWFRDQLRFGIRCLVAGPR